MPVTTPVIAELDSGVWLIRRVDGPCGYAVAGEQRGLFIDGVDLDIPFFASRLFDGRPYDHVLTSKGQGAYTGTGFELGGRTVCSVATPGFTADSVSYVDNKSGIAFVGNACGKRMICGTCVTDSLTGLVRLRHLHPEINRLYAAILPVDDYRAEPISVLEEAIGACRAALSPEAAQYADGDSMRFGSVTLTYKRLRREDEGLSPYPLGL